MRKLIHAHAPLPRGAVVRTGAGGWHLFFTHPGESVRNSAGTRLGPGIDIRGDGGYVIAPPSRHESGHSYRWDVPPDRLPELPGWLSDLLRTPERPVTPSPAQPLRIDRALSNWARAALDGEAARVRGAPVGTRNHTLNRAAFRLGQVVGAGALESDHVEQVLTNAAVAVGLTARETAMTIASGLRAGLEHPRGPSRQASRRPWASRDAEVDAEVAEVE
jgi:hypothetical protein